MTSRGIPVGLDEDGLDFGIESFVNESSQREVHTREAQALALGSLSPESTAGRSAKLATTMGTAAAAAAAAAAVTAAAAVSAAGHRAKRTKKNGESCGSGSGGAQARSAASPPVTPLNV